LHDALPIYRGAGGDAPRDVFLRDPPAQGRRLGIAGRDPRLYWPPHTTGSSLIGRPHMTPPSSPDMPDTRPASFVWLKSPTGLAFPPPLAFPSASSNGLCWPGRCSSNLTAFPFNLPSSRNLIGRPSAGDWPQCFPYNAWARPSM